MSKDDILERKDTPFDRKNKTFECKNTVCDIRAAAAAQHTHFVFIAGVVMHYMYTVMLLFTCVCCLHVSVVVDTCCWFVVIAGFVVILCVSFLLNS